MKQHPFALGFTAALIALLAMGAAYVGPWAPSPFTQRIGTNTTATAWRTALSVTNATGTEATLAGDNAFTGTNRFPAASFYGANMIGRRLLFTTNIYLPTIAVSANDLTNNGDYALCTKMFEVTLPALLSTNSMLTYSFNCVRTNVNSVGPQIVWWAGTNTNFVANGSASSAGSGTSVGKSVGNAASVIIANWWSYTNQVQGGSAQVIPNATNFTDTSSAWKIYAGFYVKTTAYTNHVATYSIYEEFSE